MKYKEYKVVKKKYLESRTEEEKRADKIQFIANIISITAILISIAAMTIEMLLMISR